MKQRYKECIRRNTREAIMAVKKRFDEGFGYRAIVKK